MAYIGKAPVNGFHSKQTLSTDGSTTTFTLDFTVADETALIVSVGGVLQEPKVAYNLSGGGTSIVFTAAPASTDTAYIQYLGQAIVQNVLNKRASEYKELKEQLDLLYHDMTADKGNKTGEWYKHIKAVKDANPKG